MWMRKKLRASIYLGGDWKRSQISFFIFIYNTVCCIHQISVVKKFAVTGITKLYAENTVFCFEIISWLI
jgi:hypothetical protein